MREQVPHELHQEMLRAVVLHMSQKAVSRKRKVHKVYDVKGDGGRKRKAGADEFAMLGLDEAVEASSIHEGSALEGLRRSCKSSLRNG